MIKATQEYKKGDKIEGKGMVIASGVEGTWSNRLPVAPQYIGKPWIVIQYGSNHGETERFWLNNGFYVRSIRAERTY